MTKSTGETKFWLKVAGAALAIIVVFTAGFWGLKVLIAEPKGAGDVHMKVNERDNRIRASEGFYTLYNQIAAYDQQLDQAALDLMAHPDSEFWAVNYTGLRKACVDAVALYNADTHKVTKAKWLDPDLPYVIDGSDPRRDCKEELGSPA